MVNSECGKIERVAALKVMACEKQSLNQAGKINESLRELFKLESSIGEILSPDTS